MSREGLESVRKRKTPPLARPKIKITIVKPGDVQKNRPKRLTREETGLRYDMSQRYVQTAEQKQALEKSVARRREAMTRVQSELDGQQDLAKPT
jgi:hypothetical protein